ncbi:MAG: MBL fold metallo-hydrolase [Candidatus Brocadiia bacterium]|nr:MAG: MBL fold metallo-hydrolase [Candidatus Brocadiia bacterium]
MAVKLQWFGHASFKISSGDTVIYIDPWKLKASHKDATVVLVSHSHYDHYSDADIAKVSDAGTSLIAPADVVQKAGKGQVLRPGEKITIKDVTITSVPAYNPAKQFHPKSNEWLGFIIEIAGKRIYYAGDTDMTDEMAALKNIDLALLPVGGTYTMNPDQAAQATEQFKPAQAVPYHWGDIVGGKADAEDFAKNAKCKVTILMPGQSLNL